MKHDNIFLSEESEDEKILRILEREANEVERRLFSALWSEHCSYKSSKKTLEQLPRGGSSVLVKAGESNAGVIDIGKGWAITFKIESHNHPSALEPFQGAATGVGGILRDILAMGARPLLLMNSLRLGEITGETKETAEARQKLKGVVEGISYYGNCVGVPNVGGEIFFEKCYQKNPLVNVLCLGVVHQDQIQNNFSANVGDLIVYFGAKTGRDGVSGADFASRDLSDSEKELEAVQVGDAFAGKRLIEACLEIFQTKLISAVQDMGAAGLACSVAEMAFRSQHGVCLHLDQVPLQQKDLNAYEILLSESQERMVLAVKEENLEMIQKIGQRWNLEVSVIGEMISRPNFEVEFKSETIVCLPIDLLVEGAPLKESSELKVSFVHQNFLPKTRRVNCHEALLKIITLPSLTSKRWVFEQFDFLVGNNTVVQPGSDAAVVRLRLGEEERFLAMTTDGNGWYCHLDPLRGTGLVVAEAARNLICSGAKPLAVTNNLNLGNPQKPERFWEFQQVVKGLAHSCKELNLPVVSGNISFYNETAQGGIYPTPVIGMVGLIEKVEWITTQGFKNEGDVIVLIGNLGKGLEGTYYQRDILKSESDRCPKLDWEDEKKACDVVQESIRKGLIKNAHDCSEGGLGLALAECCLSGNLGAEIDFRQWDKIALEEILFNENPSRIIVSLNGCYLTQLEKICEQSKISFSCLGKVSQNALKIQWQKEKLTWSVKELSEKWNESLGVYFKD